MLRWRTIFARTAKVRAALNMAAAGEFRQGRIGDEQGRSTTASGKRQETEGNQRRVIDGVVVIDAKKNPQAWTIIPALTLDRPLAIRTPNFAKLFSRE
jgi:hypothetical protein